MMGIMRWPLSEVEQGAWSFQQTYMHGAGKTLQEIQREEAKRAEAAAARAREEQAALAAAAAAAAAQASSGEPFLPVISSAVVCACIT